jgi:hypothetical protein
MRPPAVKFWDSELKRSAIMKTPLRAESVADFLARVAEVRKALKFEADDPWGPWFRGHLRAHWQLCPKLYRDWFREDLSKLFELLSTRQIQPVIAARFPLREAPHANEMLEKSQVSASSCCFLRNHEHSDCFAVRPVASNNDTTRVVLLSGAIRDSRTISLSSACTSKGGNPCHLRRHSQIHG